MEAPDTFRFLCKRWHILFVSPLFGLHERAQCCFQLPPLFNGQLSNYPKDCALCHFIKASWGLLLLSWLLHVNRLMSVYGNSHTATWSHIPAKLSFHAPQLCFVFQGCSYLNPLWDTSCSSFRHSETDLCAAPLLLMRVFSFSGSHCSKCGVLCGDSCLCVPPTS